MSRLCSTLLLLLGIGLLAHPAVADDWPMWRRDVSRSAATPAALPAKLHLQWVMELPAPRPAWDETQDRLQFDASYEPVAAGGRLFVPSMITDSVTAFDLITGEKQWQFFTNGPVRFAPACHGDGVYFVSDDGHLYCVAAKDGALRWKFRGGPSDRKVLGNDRITSMWPARGAPAIGDGVVYFAAGVWPFMGIFIHALDATTGEVVWTNSGSGTNYLVQPHGSPAFAGVSPQGYLALTSDTLIVPGGRGSPAGYDRATGEFLYCHVGELGKKSGGYEVIAADGWFANRSLLCGVREGTAVGVGDLAVVTDLYVLQQAGRKLTALARPAENKLVETVDRRGVTIKDRRITFNTLWQRELPGEISRVHLQAADTLLASDGESTIYAFPMPQDKDGTKKNVDSRREPLAPLWKTRIVGKIWSMLVADERLVVVNRTGQIFCFGEVDRQLALPPATLPAKVKSVVLSNDDGEVTIAAKLAKHTQQRDGYCLLVGADAALVKDFLTRTRCELIVLESDAAKARSLREALQAQNLLGRRATVLQGDIAAAQLPPYLFQLMVAYAVDASLLTTLAQSLRPYDGTAILATNEEQHAAITRAVENIARQQPSLATLKVARQADYTLVIREGALPGAAAWTHQGASIANTLVSDDTLVKAPLGLLWFGGPSHAGVLPRHGHGPTPQVVGGRLFIEGRDMLRAVDVYTGRLLWQRDLPEVGLYYDNTSHHPGANAIGSNYVSLADGIYVAYGRECLRLDPATGKTLATFTLPDDDSGKKPYWGYIGIDGDLLLAGSSPVLPLTKSSGVDRDAAFSRYAEGSARLVALDRHSGRVRWTRDAVFNFRHNAICAGGGKVYCIDRVTDAQEALLKRRGDVPKKPPTLYALDAASGEVVWQTEQDVFGTWLSYSAAHDVLVQATSKNRDRAADESGSGLAAYRADKGERLWLSDKGYGGPVLILGDRIITQGNACELLTGKEAKRIDPITGAESRWTFTRNYGCTTAIGCPNLLTFRSAAAGFFDLAGDGGTGNFGGFRSSCTSNLVPADGVLNAPDYTRTCTCNYQLQCSLALVHMPAAEMWTFQPDAWTGDRVRRIGINFGAPGDRKADDGTLWLEYPSVGGRSPDVPIKVDGTSEKEKPIYFREHASAYAGGPLPWVASSSVRGARKITVTLTTDKQAQAKPHVVRLVFGHQAASGPRTKFHIALQGTTVLRDFDPSETSQRVEPTPSRTNVQEFRLPLANELTISLTPASDDDTTVLAGVEIVRE